MLPGLGGYEVCRQMRLIPEPGRRAGGLPHRALARRGPGRAGRAGTGGLREQAVRARRSRRTHPPAGRGAATVVIEERLLELIRAALETAAGELGFEGDGRNRSCPHQEEGARRLRDRTSRSCSPRRAGRNPRAGGRGDLRRLPGGAVRRTRRGCRTGVPEHLRHRRLALRRAPRRRGGGRVLRSRGTHRQARPGGVRQRQPDRTAARGPCPERRARRCHRSPARARGLERGARVLLQRRGRPDGPVRRVRGGALPHPLRDRDGDPRGRLSRLLHRCAGARVEGTGWLRLRGDASRAPAPVDQTGGGGACPSVDRPIARTVRRGVRHLHVRGVPRGEATRSSRRSTGYGTRVISTRRTARCGSAPPRSATTRIAW